MTFRMWWTITGNYGNILPIDWSKSYTQKLHEQCLNLPERSVCEYLKSFFCKKS